MERMKEFILSPEEIYYIGKVSGGKYLDYDYIAAMKDIGKRGKIKQQEILDSLERKGICPGGFPGQSGSRAGMYRNIKASLSGNV